MGKLVALLMVAAVLAEVATPRVLERDVEQRVAEVLPARNVEAVVGSFPFLPPLLDEGRVAELEVTVSDLEVDPLTLDEARFTFTDLVVSRRSLVRGEVVVQAIGTGRFEAEVPTEDLAEATGVASGAVPDDLAHHVEVRDGTVTVAGQELVTTSGVLPCDPDVAVEGDVVVLACEVEDVPDVLREAVPD